MPGLPALPCHEDSRWHAFRGHLRSTEGSESSAGRAEVATRPERPMPATAARRHSQGASYACVLPHPPTAAGSLLAPTRMPASADEPTAAVPRTACACRPAQTTAGPGRSAVRAHAGHPPLPFQDNKSEQQARDRTLAIPQVLESRRASLSQGASHLRAQTGLTRVRLSSEVGGARSQRALSWGSLKRSRSFDHRSLPKGMVKPGPRRHTTSQRRLARHTSRRSNTKAGFRPACRARRLHDPMLCRSQLPFHPTPPFVPARTPTDLRVERRLLPSRWRRRPCPLSRVLTPVSP